VAFSGTGRPRQGLSLSKEWRAASDMLAERSQPVVVLFNLEATANQHPSQSILLKTKKLDRDHTHSEAASGVVVDFSGRLKPYQLESDTLLHSLEPYAVSSHGADAHSPLQNEKEKF
jgi:hypothetical protein